MDGRYWKNEGLYEIASFGHTWKEVDDFSGGSSLERALTR